MNRRGFLKGLLGLAATVMLAPLLPKVTPQPVEWVDPTVPLDRYTRLSLSTKPLVQGVAPTVDPFGQRGYAGTIWWKRSSDARVRSLHPRLAR